MTLSLLIHVQISNHRVVVGSELWNLERANLTAKFIKYSFFEKKKDDTVKRTCQPKIAVYKHCFCYKCVNHRNKRPFVSTANDALVGTLMTIGDVNDIFTIVFPSQVGWLIMQFYAFIGALVLLTHSYLGLM